MSQMLLPIKIIWVKLLGFISRDADVVGLEWSTQTCISHMDHPF